MIPVELSESPSCIDRDQALSILMTNISIFEYIASAGTDEVQNGVKEVFLLSLCFLMSTDARLQDNAVIISF